MATIEENIDRSRESDLKAYTSPKLEIFGEVSALTAAGSANAAEGEPVGMSGMVGGNLP